MGLEAVVSVVELRTAGTPPLVLDLAGPSNPLWRKLAEWLRPTVVVQPAGLVVAPFGRATAEEGRRSFLLVLVLLAVVVYVLVKLVLGALA